MQLDEQKIFEELGIDGECYHDLLGVLVLQVKDSVEELNKAIHLDDFDQVAWTAHALKGMAGNLRIEEIQTVARSLEFASKNDKDKKAIEADIVKLKEALHELELLVS